MKILFTILVILHGLIHLLGFAKSWNPESISQLTRTIPKSLGWIWLLSAILLLGYAVSYILQTNYSWIIGLLAVIISQILIIQFWQDAKFGTIPNIIILLMVLHSFGLWKFHQMVSKEISIILFENELKIADQSNLQSIKALPIPVQKWLTRSGALDRPPIQMGRVKQVAFMKMKPEQKEWYQANATQFTTIATPAFIWSVDLKMNILMQIVGRDKFTDGKGHMLIKMNALLNLADEKGDKINESTMQRYLGEMVWFPSLALSPNVNWEPLDNHSARATMTYGGTTGSGIFYFNDQGGFVKFVALRYKENKPDARRYEWVLTADDYAEFEGVRVPSKMKATWKLEDGDWTWLKLEITDLTYNQKMQKEK
jgi:hypothetical protein